MMKWCALFNSVIASSLAYCLLLCLVFFSFAQCQTIEPMLYVFVWFCSALYNINAHSNLGTVNVCYGFVVVFGVFAMIVYSNAFCLFINMMLSSFACTFFHSTYISIGSSENFFFPFYSSYFPSCILLSRQVKYYGNSCKHFLFQSQIHTRTHSLETINAITTAPNICIVRWGNRTLRFK